MPCQLLSFQDFQMSAGLVLSNNTVIILQIRKYLTLLIGDSIIAGLSRYANIWKGYFQLLNAINCGVGEDSAKYFRGCHNLPSYPYLLNVIIMYGTNNIQHNIVVDIVTVIAEIVL